MSLEGEEEILDDNNVTQRRKIEHVFNFDSKRVSQSILCYKKQWLREILLLALPLASWGDFGNVTHPHVP